MNTQPQPHVLVVDDDPQIRELLQEYFAENGMRVSVALNGAQMSQNTWGRFVHFYHTVMPLSHTKS